MMVTLLVPVDVGVAAATAGPSKTVALDIFVGSATLVAASVTRESALTLAGAVYRPVELIEPTPMRIFQVTARLFVPPTVAVNCVDCPPYK
jgi:hypothetical protein